MIDVTWRESQTSGKFVGECVFEGTLDSDMGPIFQYIKVKIEENQKRKWNEVIVTYGGCGSVSIFPGMDNDAILGIDFIDIGTREEEAYDNLPVEKAEKVAEHLHEEIRVKFAEPLAKILGKVLRYDPLVS